MSSFCTSVLNGLVRLFYKQNILQDAVWKAQHLQSTAYSKCILFLLSKQAKFCAINFGCCEN